MKILLKGRALLISLITALLILGALAIYTALFNQAESGIWLLDRDQLSDTAPDPSPATPTPVRLGPMELQQAQWEAAR